MSSGLFSGVSGLALGTGLYRNVSGLWGGAAGLIDGFGGGSPFGGASLYLNFLAGAPIDSRITFTRGTNATLVDSTGKITYAPSNLLTYSEFPNGVTDAPTRGGLLTATTFSGLTGTTGLAFGYDGTTSTFAYKPGAVTGTAYVFSVYVRMDDGGAPVFGNAAGSSVNNTFAIGIGGAVSVPTSYIVVNMGGGLYRVSGAAVTGGVPTNSGIVKYNSNDNRTFKVSGYQLEPVTYQTTPNTYNATTSAAYYGPRFDYDPVTLAPKGILIEEQRVNLLTYSAQFDNAAWTKLRATVTANSTTSPDGTSNADTLLDTAVAGTHIAIQLITKAASALTYATTIYLKKDVRDQGEFRMSDQAGNGVRCTFNLTTGVIGTAAAFGIGFVAGSSQITNAGNGWYRLTLTGTTNAVVTLGSEVYIADASGSLSYTGTGAGFFVWGAQLEQASFATSYIPTVASTVTRNADVATMTGTNFSSWYNQTEGTFVADGSLPTVSVAFPNFYTVSTGLGSNRITQGTPSGTMALTVVSGSVMQVSLSSGFPPSTTPFKVASSYKLDDFASCLSGGTVVTDTSGILPIGVDRIAIGTNATTTGAFANGHIRQLAYFNTRLSDAQLQELTAPPLVTTLSLDFTNGIYDA